MTPYRFDNQKQKQAFSRKKIVGIFLGIVILVGVLVFGIAPLVQRAAEGPLWLHDALVRGSDRVIDNLTPKKIIIQRYQALQEKIQMYEIQLLELDMMRDENARLRDAVSYIDIPSNIIFASVIAKPSQSLYNSIIIDRGADAGIEVGQLVTTQ
jgi:cell shape-determining protein MreC